LQSENKKLFFVRKRLLKALGAVKLLGNGARKKSEERRFEINVEWKRKRMR
jgi:hypothetical protein